MAPDAIADAGGCPGVGRDQRAHHFAAGDDSRLYSRWPCRRASVRGFAAALGVHDDALPPKAAGERTHLHRNRGACRQGGLRDWRACALRIVRQRKSACCSATFRRAAPRVWIRSRRCGTSDAPCLLPCGEVRVEYGPGFGTAEKKSPTGVRASSRRVEDWHQVRVPGQGSGCAGLRSLPRTVASDPACDGYGLGRGVVATLGGRIGSTTFG